MAGVNGVATKDEVATGTSKKTIIQIVAASGHRVVVPAVNIGFRGTDSNAVPVLVQIIRQTSAGTMTALTTQKIDSESQSLATTALHTATAEPTTGAVLFNISVHPKGGALHFIRPDSPFVLNSGERLGVAVTAAADVTCDCNVFFRE